VTDAVPLPHLYPVLGDGRLNIIASRAALDVLAAALAALAADGEPRRFSLTRCEMPHYGMSCANLECARSDEPLLCLLEDDAVRISGHAKGLLLLSENVSSQAQNWDEGGHVHVYPGTDWRGEMLVSPRSEEVLIGGCGYVPNEMFGLPDDDEA